MYKASGRAAAKSIRLDQNLIEILEDEAERKNMSTNALIERVLLKYAKYYRHLENYPVLILSQSEFQSLMREIPDERIEELGWELGRNIRGYFLMRGINPDLDSVISILEENYADGAGWFDLHYHNRDGRRLLHFSHRNGLKWSKFLASYIKSIFKELMDTEIEIEYTESYVTTRM
jgi:hypothetical protein